jgi:hypothetical protein
LMHTAIVAKKNDAASIHSACISPPEAAREPGLPRPCGRPQESCALNAGRRCP